MDHLEHFRGNRARAAIELAAQRAIVIGYCRLLQPNNFEKLIKSSEHGETDVELSWVTVADPGSSNDIPALEVLPVLGFWEGDVDMGIEPGLSSLTIVGKLPNGEEKIIGNISNLRPSPSSTEPLLQLNRVSSDAAELRSVEWDEADAELFLKLAYSAFEAQNLQH
jgi:hypothetical protein